MISFNVLKCKEEGFDIIIKSKNFEKKSCLSTFLINVGVSVRPPFFVLKLCI